MSDGDAFPIFPVPFWDYLTVMLAHYDAGDMERMVMPTPRTLLEKKLDSFTEAIRDKPLWWEKVHRADVIDQWRKEAEEQGLDSHAFDFGMQQLRHQASQCKDGIRPSPVQGVFESEHLLDDQLQQDLLKALKPLEEVPYDQKDWHPGSNEQVVDLVHPSLFPLVYGLSRSTTGAAPAAPRTAAVPVIPDIGAPRIAVDRFEADPSVLPPPCRPAAAAAPPSTAAAAPPGGWGAQHAQDGQAAAAPVGAGAAEEPMAPAEGAGESMHAAQEGVDESDAAAATDGAHAEGPGHPTESREEVAAAAAAAPSWHTPAFTSWKTDMGAGTTIRNPPAPSAFVSDRFQWLPADVLVGADGRVVFDSYVNNLHPECHAALYAVTARLLERAVPLFERTLAASAQPPRRVVEMVPPENPDWDCTVAEMWEKMKETGEAEECRAAWRAANADGQGLQGGEEGDDHAEFADQMHELWLLRRVWASAVPGLPQHFEPPPPPPHVDLKRRRLQVIVKFAEIVVTPEKPRYGGGVWHVEGMENEAIVASCIAYLSHDNLSESRLHFRTMVTDLPYENDGTDDDRLRVDYGIVDEMTMNEPLGSALCAPGRMLCWPNAFQHRVAPFELADASRPGVRRFAVLFLVDPRCRVLSTRDVPPQQMAWHDAESRLGSALPGELKQKVDALREFPVSLERAKALRLHLMNERKYVVGRENWEVYERKFTLCEH